MAVVQYALILATIQLTYTADNNEECNQTRSILSHNFFGIQTLQYNDYEP